MVEENNELFEHTIGQGKEDEDSKLSIESFSSSENLNNDKIEKISFFDGTKRSTINASPPITLSLLGKTEISNHERTVIAFGHFIDLQAIFFIVVFNCTFPWLSINKANNE